MNRHKQKNKGKQKECVKRVQKAWGHLKMADTLLFILLKLGRKNLS